MSHAVISAEDKKQISSKIFYDRVKILHDYLLAPTLPAVILCSTLVFLGLYELENKMLLSIWYGATLLICAFRYLMLKYYQRDKNNPSKHLKIFILGSTLSGLMWGIAGTILTPPHALLHKGFIIIIIAGLNAGGSQTLRASRAANSLFILSSILPFGIWTLFQYYNIYTYLNLTIFGYLIFMLVLANKSYLQFINSLQLFYENEFLVKKLKKTNDRLNHEILDHEQAKGKLRYLASHDYLTGIDNRLSFDGQFAKTLIYSKIEHSPFCVMFIDVDHFKNINDQYGHDIGDTLLIEMVKQIQKSLKPKDILARMGGDEFIILMTGNNVKIRAEQFCEQMYLTFQQPFRINHNSISVSLSIGCSFYPDDGDTRLLLLKKADLALYQAKLKGRNCYEFYQEEETVTE